MGFFRIHRKKQWANQGVGYAHKSWWVDPNKLALYRLLPMESPESDSKKRFLLFARWSYRLFRGFDPAPIAQNLSRLEIGFVGHLLAFFNPVA